MRVGFVGLGNVGAKLAGSLLRNGHDLMVHDLNQDFVAEFVTRGAVDGGDSANLMRECEAVITCLPSPQACDAVVSQMIPRKSCLARSGWRCRRPTRLKSRALVRLLLRKVARRSNVRFLVVVIAQRPETLAFLLAVNGKRLNVFCRF